MFLFISHVFFKDIYMALIAFLFLYYSNSHYSIYGCFTGYFWLSFFTCYIREHLGIDSAVFLWADCRSCHPVNSIKAVMKTHCTQTWPHPFFIHHWTADGRAFIAPSVLAV